MFFHHGFYMFGRHLCIKCALGVNNHDGTERAQSETTRFYYENIVDIVLGKRFFELFDDFKRVR